jgi:hypothetical protein
MPREGSVYIFLDSTAVGTFVRQIAKDFLIFLPPLSHWSPKNFPRY